MPTTYTNLLGLALPATGELSGTWGDTVNSFITQYLDAAIAGAQTISGSQTAVTLSAANGTSLVVAGSGAAGSSQYSIINCTGNPASTLTITAPTASKVYLVLNATSTAQSVVVKPAGNPGITVSAGRAALIAWNGSDFTLVGTNDLARMSGTLPVASLTGTLPVANGGTGQTTVNAALDSLMSGTSRRFVADFSNATVASRALFQTFTANTPTNVGIVPNGSANQSAVLAFNASDPTNASAATLIGGASEVSLRSTRAGSGAYLPLALYTSDLPRLTVAANGNVGVGTSSPATVLDVFGPAGVTSFTGTAWQGIRARGSSTSTDYSGIDLSSQGATTPLARIGAVFGGGGSTLQFGTSNNYAAGITNAALSIRPDASLWTNDNTQPVELCRARVSFDGTTGALYQVGGTGNVSSVTRNGTGDYTINFVTALQDTAYTVVPCASLSTGLGASICNINSRNAAGAVVAPTTTAMRMAVNVSGIGPVDAVYVSVAVFR